MATISAIGLPTAISGKKLVGNHDGDLHLSLYGTAVPSVIK